MQSPNGNQQGDIWVMVGRVLACVHGWARQGAGPTPGWPVCTPTSTPQEISNPMRGSQGRVGGPGLARRLARGPVGHPCRGSGHPPRGDQPGVAPRTHPLPTHTKIPLVHPDYRGKGGEGYSGNTGEGWGGSWCTIYAGMVRWWSRRVCWVWARCELLN